MKMAEEFREQARQARRLADELDELAANLEKLDEAIHQRINAANYTGVRYFDSMCKPAANQH